jgi:hypothetical protein
VSASLVGLVLCGPFLVVVGERRQVLRYRHTSQRDGMRRLSSAALMELGGWVLLVVRDGQPAVLQLGRRRAVVKRLRLDLVSVLIPWGSEVWGLLGLLLRFLRLEGVVTDSPVPELGQQKGGLLSALATGY